MLSRSFFLSLVFSAGLLPSFCSASASSPGASHICNDGKREVLALEHVDRNPRVWWIGEVHGTQEIPTLVGDLVCRQGSIGKNVVLALEFNPTQNQAAVDNYLNGRGHDVERALLAAPMWKDRGGRASEAIFHLIERVRNFRRAGIKVEIVGIDPIPAEQGTSVQREVGIAAGLKVLASTRDRVVALTGYAHVSLDPIVIDGRDIPSAASYLTDVATIRLRPLPVGGEAWYCSAEAAGGAEVCGPKSGSGRAEVEPRGIYIDHDRFPGFDGYYSTGRRFAMSPPQVGAVGP